MKCRPSPFETHISPDAFKVLIEFDDDDDDLSSQPSLTVRFL